MKSKEFYRTPTGDIMIHDKNGCHVLSQNDRDFISAFMRKMWEFWPEAISALSKEYEKSKANIPFYEFSIVKRFLKCNFGRYDNTLDVDQIGHFHFEEVECPLRGECKYETIVCRPKFNSRLTEREIEVMRCYYEGMDTIKIADRLCISPETVSTHRKNALKRVGSHSIQEFFIYARGNNLFKF